MPPDIPPPIGGMLLLLLLLLPMLPNADMEGEGLTPRLLVPLLPPLLLPPPIPMGPVGGGREAGLGAPFPSCN